MDTGDIVLAALVALATAGGAGVGAIIAAQITRRSEEQRARRQDALEQRARRLAARLLSSDIASVLAAVNQALNNREARHAQLKCDLPTTWRDHRSSLADFTTEQWDTVDTAVAYVAEFPWRPAGTEEPWSPDLESNLTDLRPDLEAAFRVLRAHVD